MNFESLPDVLVPSDFQAFEYLLQLFGWNFIGLIFSVVILGILTVQTYFYFNKFNDSRFTQGIVLLMIAAEYGIVISQVQAFYTGLLGSWGNPMRLIVLLTERSTVLFSIGILQSCIVQGFFLVRIWVLSKSYWKTVVVLVTVLNQIAWGLALIFIWNKNKLVDPLQGRLYLVLIAWVIGEIIADVSVAGMLSLLLYTKKSRSGIAKTNSLLNKLILYTVSTGAITAFMSLLIAISVLNKDPPFLGLVGEPYASFFPLAMLANLHSRSRVQQWEKKLRQGGNHVTYKSGVRPSGVSRPTNDRLEGIEMKPSSFFSRTTGQARPSRNEAIIGITLSHSEPNPISQARSAETTTEYSSAIEVSVFCSEETDHYPPSKL